MGLRNTKNEPSYPFDLYPFLQFRIFLREDDLKVLEKIKDFLGFGKIYKKSLNYNRRLGFKSRDQYNYVASSIKDLLKLKEFLTDGKFFTKKEEDIKLFFKILDMKIAKKHLNKEGYDEILHLTNQINSKMRKNFKVGGKRNLYTMNNNKNL